MGDPIETFMWRRMDPRLTSSGQPTEEQLAAIAGLGVTHIINLGLHSHEKALPDEAASLAALGMVYIHIPVPFDDPTDDHFMQFRAAMDSVAAGPAHVHCIANLRASAFLYRYRREQIEIGEMAAAAELDNVWRPGGVWARFVGRNDAIHDDHRYAGRDY